MADYPVTFDSVRPDKFERPQVFLRIIVYFVFSFISGALYLALPVLAAIWISQKGADKYLQDDGPRIKGWLRWAVGIEAYTFMLTDHFPSGDDDPSVRFDLRAGGSPTVGSALLRLIMSIPSAIVLGVLTWVSAIIWIIAAIQVLAQESYSGGLYDFQRGVVRWQARLYAYHASLVDEYPPFAFDTGAEAAPAA
ncbi:MAG: DUF4389 domain-containing protein [Dehalococcoidia bacterium]|nr:DUF4389 domain-containing protein [Dehalococcoidia bacterium]